MMSKQLMAALLGAAALLAGASSVPAGNDPGQ